jgi:lipopolysaccharide biosynthesis regulator YciM
MSKEAVKQPEALRLADALDELDRQFSRNGLCGDAAAELRRLHEVNQDLLKALNTILNICLLDNGHWAKTIEREAHEAIAKATGEKS